MRVAIIGGGQLGRMLGEAAHPLGVAVRFLDPGDAPCARTAGPVTQGRFDDLAALEALAAWADVVTYEFENVPVDAVAAIRGAPVYPPPGALRVAQDRLTEKTFFRDLGIDVAPFAPVDDLAGLRAAVGVLGRPSLLKTRRFGYDGKGQSRFGDRGTPGDLEAAWEQVGGVPCVLEGFVPFDRELSILAARRPSGEVRCWPLVENEHRAGVLHRSVSPASADAPLQRQAESIVRHAMEALDYVGVLTIELFDVGGQLVVNEMAPRVHNSGHGTIEGSVTSQFENHLRAVLDLPLGDTDAVQPWGMRNLLGAEPPLAELLALSGVRVHRYDKAPRPGRKVGHVTVLGPTAEARGERLGAVERLIEAHRA